MSLESMFLLSLPTFLPTSQFSLLSSHPSPSSGLLALTQLSEQAVLTSLRPSLRLSVETLYFWLLTLTRLFSNKSSMVSTLLKDSLTPPPLSTALILLMPPPSSISSQLSSRRPPVL